MNLRNKATILLLNQIETVQCGFDAKYVEGLTKLYTYKAKKGSYKPGDVAVVETNGQYKFVRIAIVDETPNIDPYASFEYQWLIQKIDFTDYQKALDAEKTLMEYLRNAERTQLIDSVKNEVKESLPESAMQDINAISLDTEAEETD